MNQPLAFEENFRGYALDGIMDQVKVFVNPIMKSMVLSYDLKEDANVKVQIVNLKGQLVYDYFYVMGNPGGRAGENKVIWKGVYQNGIKVPSGKYRVLFVVNGLVVKKEEVCKY